MQSLWLLENKKEEYKSLRENKEVEVCIIGGGLTGITCGYLLSKQGYPVCILEKDTILSKTSGNTTAKITSQHGLFYEYLIDTFGKETAQKYYEANENAIQEIEKIIKQEKIDCDFEKQPSYVFTNEQSEVEKIKLEVKAVNSIGGDRKFVEKTELPFPHLGAIVFPNQAMFHPVKYGKALAQKIIEQKRNDL